MHERPPLSFRTSAKIGLLTFVVLSVLTGMIIFSLPRTYVATARVDLVMKAAKPFDPYVIQTEVERIKSDAILVPALLELRRNGLFQPSSPRRSTAATDDKSEARALLKNLDFRQSRGTSLIEIQAFDSNPTTAAEVANTVARIYAAQPKPASGPENIRIIELAQPPTHYVRPKIAILIALATVLNTIFALMAGVFAANLFR